MSFWTSIRTIALVSLLVNAGATAARGQSVPGGLQVHGFLNQAYARSNGHQLLGIPQSGTWDYRTAALQFRYAATDRNSFVVQLSYERIGESPVAETKPDVGLDWLFFQHNVAGTSVRIGKVKVPHGIYNEIRDVGILLPFYRPPMSMYGELAYSTETIEGAAVGHRFGIGTWSLDADLFVGEWSILQYDLATTARANNGAGFQVWLNTPVNGVRAGIGGRRATFTGLLDFPADSELTETELHVSLDLQRGRGLLRAEVSREVYADFVWRAGYVQAGLDLTSRLSLFGQAEIGHWAVSGGAGAVSKVWSRELASGMRYALQPNLVVKAALHWNSSYDIEDTYVDFYSQPAARTRFGVISVSTSF